MATKEPEKPPVVSENIVHISKINTRLVKDIFDIFVRTACNEPEFYTDEEYLGEDTPFGLAFSVEGATQKIISSLTIEDPTNPVSVCSGYSPSEEGVMFFRKPFGSDQIAIEYDPGAYYRHKDLEQRTNSFNSELQNYLKSEGLII